METKIQPVQVFPHMADTIKIGGASITKLGDGGQAQVGWALFTQDGLQVQSGGVEISGPEYDAWGSDDTYLINLVVSKLGLTPQ